MKISRTADQSGGVLFTALILSLLVSLVVGALLMVSKQQSYLTARSATWCSEIPIAEAGVEEALAHINSGLSNWVAGGWQKDASGKYFFQRRNIGENGYFYATITTSRPPTVVSIGYGRIPLQTNFTSRTVMVTTKSSPPVWGIVGLNRVTISGSTVVDSFNSTNPASSTLGLYDPLKRLDHAGVGTPSTNKPAITIGSKVYGYAATGPGGTVSGTVGDGAWVTSSSGPQPGRVFDDFNMAIPDVLLPFTTATQSPFLGTNILGITYDYAFVKDGDYIINGKWQPDKNGVLISAKVRIYVTDIIKFTGSAKLIIAEGGSVEIYAGADANFGGNGIVNSAGAAKNAVLYGLPTCTSLKIAGGVDMITRIYAPNSDVTVGGSGDVMGSLVGKTVTVNGNAGVHYDEALGFTTQEWRVASWEEL